MNVYQYVYEVYYYEFHYHESLSLLLGTPTSWNSNNSINYSIDTCVSLNTNLNPHVTTLYTE